MRTGTTKKRVIVFLIVVFILAIFSIFSNQIKSFVYEKSSDLQALLWQTGMNQRTNEAIRVLTEENQKLLSQLSELEKFKNENEFLRQALNLEMEKEFNLILANATAKNTFTFKGVTFEDSILIDKGKNNGIRKDFPVILSNKILIGKIAEVYDSFSRVELITNKENMIDVQIQDTDAFALSKGEGNLKISLDLFSKDKELKEDSLVYTSALGGLYPSGLVVGKIKNIQKIDNEPYIKADIVSSFDLFQLSQVFVIKTTQIIDD
jgi:rod shape-determining protein MreC